MCGEDNSVDRFIKIISKMTKKKIEEYLAEVRKELSEEGYEFFEKLISDIRTMNLSS